MGKRTTSGWSFESSDASACAGSTPDGTAAGLKEKPTSGGFSGVGAGSTARVGNAAAGTITDTRAVAMTVASRLTTEVSMSQFHEKTLRMGLGLTSAADVAPLKDEKPRDDEEKEEDGYGD